MRELTNDIAAVAVFKGDLAEQLLNNAQHEHSLVMREITIDNAVISNIRRLNKINEREWAIDKAVSTELKRLNAIADKMAKINAFDFKNRW